jgi:hypothetical protein
MWRLREHAWPVSLIIIACSAFWFFRDNPSVPWSGLITDRSMLMLGLVPLIYTIHCTLDLWLGPKRLLHNHRWLADLSQEVQARLAAVEARGRERRRLWSDSRLCLRPLR